MIALGFTTGAFILGIMLGRIIELWRANQSMRRLVAQLDAARQEAA